MKPRRDNNKTTSVTFAVLSLLGMAPMVFSTAGCAVVLAAKQPDAKDLSVLNTGTPRTHVIAELGPPVWSGEKDGRRVDIFAFTQGYSKGSKAARAFAHGVADVFTLGLWEVVGTPIESVATGTQMKVEVTYDEKDMVKTAEPIGQEKPKDTAQGEERPATVQTQDSAQRETTSQRPPEQAKAEEPAAASVNAEEGMKPPR